MLRITQELAIDEGDIAYAFVRASGPGGQNVNKVASAVQLRFDAARSAALTDDVRRRLTRLAGARMTKDGVVVIEAQRFRSQERNRQDALDRLAALLRQAAIRPKKRIKTRPGAGAKQRRLDAKRRRAHLKGARGPVRERD
jgi:ribosome-associated protein